MAMQPLREALQQLLHYTNAFICMHLVSNLLCSASIARFTPEQMFSAPFVTAEPFLNGLVPSTAAASTPAATAPATAASTSASAPGPSEQRAPMEQDEGNTSTLTVKAQKPQSKH
jgi:hypothetical protein